MELLHFTVQIQHLYSNQTLGATLLMVGWRTHLEDRRLSTEGYVTSQSPGATTPFRSSDPHEVERETRGAQFEQHCYDHSFFNHCMKRIVFTI